MIIGHGILVVGRLRGWTNFGICPGVTFVISLCKNGQNTLGTVHKNLDKYTYF